MPRAAALSLNVREDAEGKSAWGRRRGAKWIGPALPFGCRMSFAPSLRTNGRRATGHVWTQDCWMISLEDLAQFRSGQIKAVHFHQTAEVFDDHEHP
eukprot:174648-Alexandrium_andersonii.AAC.1